MVTFRSNATDYLKAAVVLAIGFTIVALDMSGTFGVAEHAWY